MTLEQINIYTNISKISLSMADSVMMFTRQCDHVYYVKHTKSSLLFKTYIFYEITHKIYLIQS